VVKIFQGGEFRGSESRDKVLTAVFFGFFFFELVLCIDQTMASRVRDTSEIGLASC